MHTRDRLRRRILCTAVAGVCVGFVSVPAAAVVTSNTGLSINSYLGADTFYSNGYTGSRAIVGSIGGGHIWNQHETLRHVSVFIDDPQTPAPNGDFDRAATVGGFIIGGRPTGTNSDEMQRGIAYGAELWSGAAATSWIGPAYSFSWNKTTQSIHYPFYTMMVGGVDGRTADVINAAYGDRPYDNSYRNGRIFDAFVNQTGKTLVTIAGTGGGTTTPQVWGIGSNFNNITVGELQGETTSPPFDSPTARSSHGPNDFWNPATGTFVPAVLAPVDLAAPGTSITRAWYGGLTGGNLGGVEEPGDNLYRPNALGMNVNLVVGGAALLVDAGKDRFGGGTAIDGRVIKSVLQNSAAKTSGWNNGQSIVTGVVTTSQSLDYFVGAGRMNLDQAYRQYTTGTTDVEGWGGGRVSSIGWDFGRVAQGTSNDYLIAEPLQGGSKLTATLNWFTDNSYDYATDALVDGSLDNLDLQVWRVTDGDDVPDVLVAQSISTYNNVEHLSFALPETGQYMLRVVWTGEVFDMLDDPNHEMFGVAWSAVIPEPGLLSLLPFAALLAARRVRSVRARRRLRC